jgi:hypothetical protein
LCLFAPEDEMNATAIRQESRACRITAGNPRWAEKVPDARKEAGQRNLPFAIHRYAYEYEREITTAVWRSFFAILVLPSLSHRRADMFDGKPQNHIPPARARPAGVSRYTVPVNQPQSQDPLTGG